MIEWFTFKASVIRRLGYDPLTNTMYIDFEGSDVDLPYSGIPEELFRSFVASSSLTTFYNSHIKNNYETPLVNS